MAIMADEKWIFAQGGSKRRTQIRNTYRRVLQPGAWAAALAPVSLSGAGAVRQPPRYWHQTPGFGYSYHLPTDTAYALRTVNNFALPSPVFMQSCDPFGRNSIAFGCERESHIPLDATPLGGQVDLEAYQDRAALPFLPSPRRCRCYSPRAGGPGQLNRSTAPECFTRRDWWFTVPFSAVQALGAPVKRVDP